MWALSLLVVLAAGASCDTASPTLKITLWHKDVIADDGYPLSAIDLHVQGHPREETPLVWAFYLVGSEPVSVMDSTGQFADFVARGFTVVLLQPRGIDDEGVVDESVFQQYETRQRRVADQRAVMDAYLGSATDVPVLLVGSSQGGVVAADLAASDPRVTHLIMMGSGGGLTQAEELAILVAREPGYLGLGSTADLDAKLAEIQAAPDAGTMWAGHPYRMWSSYLWFRSVDGLATLTIPMLLLQGTADDSTPVESARTLRDTLAGLGRTNLTYVEYPGLDHHFADTSGGSHSGEVQRDVYTWLTAAGLFPTTP